MDDQGALNEVCREHQLWHHIDACWGGIMAFSDKQKYMFAGAEKVDSIAVNAHKAFKVPI